MELTIVNPHPKYPRVGLIDNSTLLGPVGPAGYVFVNHARWDMSLPRFAARQFGKRTFYACVLANSAPTPPPPCPSCTTWPEGVPHEHAWHARLRRANGTPARRRP